mgnify:CR=1 FL=1
MRTALLQVKEELGAEAVIMSNKKVAGGVAIVAAIDSESNPSQASAASQQNRGASQSNRYNEHRQMSSSSADRYQDRHLDEDKINCNLIVSSINEDHYVCNNLDCLMEISKVTGFHLYHYDDIDYLQVRNFGAKKYLN